MKKSIIYILVTTLFISSCAFIGNLSDQSKISKELINCILEEDYDKAYSLFAFDENSDVPIDSIKSEIGNFREVIVNNFGTNVDLTLVFAEKIVFNSADPNPKPTKVQIQIENDTHYGYFTILFDDSINKVQNINLEDIKNEVPSMTIFWLYSFIPLIILGFNIYTIRRVVKSSVKRKWLKIIGIILLNIPSISYSLTHGFQIDFLSFQFLLGIGFGMMGYINTYLTIGIPIGSFIAHYKIEKAKNRLENDSFNINENEKKA